MSPRRIIKDLVYASLPGRDLLLDLYLPPDAKRPLSTIVWVHGGGWQAGTKEKPLAARMTAQGYAVASVDYRLSHEAIFPAQIYDCKAAVRWLRANAPTYGLDPQRFGAWGDSAGGHLVALLGTSGGVADLEGDEGHPEQSSRVQAVCDYYGPSHFGEMVKFPSQIRRDGPDCPEALLIGGALAEYPERIERASPLTYVSPDDPPFLILHGDRDDIVPINQSELLYAALLKAGVEVTYHVVEGAGHGFGAKEPVALVDAFFGRRLKGR